MKNLNNTYKVGNENHFDILDSLRAIAAVIVCLFHFTNGHMPKLTNNFSAYLFSQGGVGVYVFFVISGFVIPYVLHKANYQPSIRAFSNYIGKRIIRIWPPSVLAIIAMVVLWFVIDALFSSEFTYMTRFSWIGLLANSFYIAPFFGFKWFNAVIWTLSVEFQYYIFIGVFYKLIFRDQFSLIRSTLVLSLPMLFHYPIYPISEEAILRNVFFIYYPFFALGFITLQFKLQQLSKIAFYSFVGLIGIITIFYYDYIVALSVVGTSLTIVYVNYKNKILGFFGQISYSIYLTHMISGATYEGVITKFIDANNDFTKCLLQFLGFIFSVFCAYAFFLIIEKPFINISNLVFKRNNKEI